MSSGSKKMEIARKLYDQGYSHKSTYQLICDKYGEGYIAHNTIRKYFQAFDSEPREEVRPPKMPFTIKEELEDRELSRKTVVSLENIINETRCLDKCSDQFMLESLEFHLSNSSLVLPPEEPSRVPDPVPPPPATPPPVEVIVKEEFEIPAVPEGFPVDTCPTLQTAIVQSYPKRFQRFLILHNFHGGKSALECAREINSQYGEDTVSVSLIRYWYQRFEEGDFCLEDKPRVGRPPKKKKTC